MYMLCLVAQSGLTLCDPIDWEPARHLCPWGFSRQEYWTGLPCAPPRDLPNQGSNTGLLHYRWILYHLSHRLAIKSYEKIIEAIFNI